MDIGLFTSIYYNNIGNAFIDIGAEAAIKKASETNGNIIKISQCPNFAVSTSNKISLKENIFLHWLWLLIMQKYQKKIHDKVYLTVKERNVFNLLNIAELDYLIIPGCVLTVPFFTIYKKLILSVKDRGTKIIFLGVSGNYYDKTEKDFVSKSLEEIRPYALITRDRIAYTLYSKYSNYIYNGIDNAFFVNLTDIRKTKTYMTPYTVLTFDEPQNAHIKNILKKEIKTNIILSNHKPYSYNNMRKYINKGYIISDYPQDYLYLYSNAELVYTDRVHACIPTLSFGNKCKLFSDSKRIELFENVDIHNITKEIATLDSNKLKEKQDSQILFLKSILK